MNNIVKALFIMGLLPVIVMANIQHGIGFGNWQNDLEIGQDSIWMHLDYSGQNGKISEPGEPELPIKVIHLIIPRDEQVDSVVIDYFDTTHIGDYLPYPAQEPCGTCMDDTIPPVFTEPDSNIYSDSDAYPDSIVKLSKTLFYDGANKIVTLEIYPICFLGEDTLVYGNDSIAFTLYTSATADTGNIASVRTELANKELEEGLKALVDNDEDIPNYSYFPSTDDEEDAYDYLIITQDSLVDYWCRFAEWKRDLGYKVGIRTVSWILTHYSGATDTDKIKSYLTIAWEDFGAVNVLLGGDFLNVPGWRVWDDHTTPPSWAYRDAEYSTAYGVSGFIYIFLRVTRIPAKNGTDITNWID